MLIISTLCLLCICIVCLILSSLHPTDNHECEILRGGPESEAAESGTLWRECKKNPEHEEFISVKDFKDIYLPRVHTDKQRDMLRAVINLTVRLRLYWTSPERPDGDKFSNHRGTQKPRMGTGFIIRIYDPVSDKPCPCVECNGKITRKFWKIRVRTAAHVVYNTEEAKSTRVDLFYDDDSCKLDGKMVTVAGLEVLWVSPDKDLCFMMCVTHDEALAEVIKSAYSCWWSGCRQPLDLSGVDFLPSCRRGRDRILIVSHPHGQPKKVTLGQGSFREDPHVKYNTATCPGSSGAPVFEFCIDQVNFRFYKILPPLHSGSSTSTSTEHRDQLNAHKTFLQECKGGGKKQEQRNFGIWIF